MDAHSHSGAVSGLSEPGSSQSAVVGLAEASVQTHAPAREIEPDIHLPFSQIRFLLIGVTVALVFGSMVSLPPIIGMNDASRWSTAWALSTGQGYVIDYAPEAWETCDKVFRDGHFYSSKPALMPTVLGGLVWVSTLGNRLQFNGDYERWHVRVILLLINVLPLAIMLLLYDRLLEKWKISAGARLFCLAGAGLGTYVTAYSNTLNNHTQAAWSVFFSLYCLFRILDQPQVGKWWYIGCTFFASWAAVNENPAIAYLVLLMGILLVKRRRQTLCYGLPVVAIMLGAYFFTTYLATGRLYPYSLNYDKETLYNYPGNVWQKPRGIDAQFEPKWWYALNLTIGHHGLLSLTPIFIFSVWGMLRQKRLTAAEGIGQSYRIVNQLGLILLVSITLLYIFATHNYGGGCQGPRWLIWLTPFLLISLPPVIHRHFHARTFRFFAWFALLISIYSIGYALSKGAWGHERDSWLHWVFRYAGLVKY